MNTFDVLFEKMLQEDSSEKEPWQVPAKEWNKDKLVHATPESKPFDYVEPRIGDTIRQAYQEDYEAAGIDFDEEIKPLAFFRWLDEINDVIHFATGATGDNKRGKYDGYILITEVPEDAQQLLEDEKVLDINSGEKYYSQFPVIVESGDIVSEEGAYVIKSIPVRDYIKSKAKSAHEYFVMKAIQEGKPVPPEVLQDYQNEPWAKEALRRK